MFPHRLEYLLLLSHSSFLSSCWAATCIFTASWLIKKHYFLHYKHKFLAKKNKKPLSQQTYKLQIQSLYKKEKKTVYNSSSFCSFSNKHSNTSKQQPSSSLSNAHPSSQRFRLQFVADVLIFQLAPNCSLQDWSLVTIQSLFTQQAFLFFCVERSRLFRGDTGTRKSQQRWRDQRQHRQQRLRKRC